jgi:hypothetical protein
MGSQDKGGREAKKPKKGSVKISSASAVTETSFEPELMKKSKKK